MRRGDIADGLWTIPAEAREKQNAGELPLSKMVLDIIKAQPRVEGNEFVFPGNGKLPMSGFSPLKKVLDEKIAEANDGKPLARWTLHDLRRTARSLMSDVGVPSDDAERVLGHKIKGVEGTYNRSKHIEQKRLALRKLAAEVGRILNPPENNVVRLRGARR
jgi:integrase